MDLARLMRSDMLTHYPQNFRCLMDDRMANCKSRMSMQTGCAQHMSAGASQALLCPQSGLLNMPCAST